MKKILKKLTALSMVAVLLITTTPITVQALGDRPSLRLEQVGVMEAGTGIIRMRLSGYVPENQIEAARILFSIDANALTPYCVDKKTPALLSNGGENNIYGQKGENPNLVIGGIAPETFNVPEITYVANQKKNDRILIYYEVTAKTPIPSRQKQPLGDLYFLVKDKDIANLSTNSFRMGTKMEIEEIEQAKEIAALQFGDSDGYWYGYNPQEGYNGNKYDESTEMATKDEVGFTHSNIDMRACTSLTITTGTTTVAVPTKTEGTTTTTRAYTIAAKYTDNLNDEYPTATDLKWDFCDMNGRLVADPVGITKAQTNNMDNGNIIVTNKAQAGNVYLRPMNYTKVGAPILFTITKAMPSAAIMEFTKGADNLQTTSQAFIADGEEYKAIVLDQFGDVLENVAEGDIVYTMPAYNGNTSAAVLELTRDGVALPKIKYTENSEPKDVNPEDLLFITAIYGNLNAVKTVTIKREELVLTTIDITCNKTGNMVIPLDGKAPNEYILSATVKDQFGGNFADTILTWDLGEVGTGIGSTEIDNFTMKITIAPEALEKDLDITISQTKNTVKGSFKGILVKQVEPKINLNLGNSPYAEIEKENKGNDATIASLKETFDTKYTYSGTKYSKRAWGDTDEVAPYTIEGKRTVVEEGQYINYDKDNKAIFIYENEDSFIEPGYVLTDENKNVLDPSLVTRSVKVKVLPTISTGSDLDTIHKDMIAEFSDAAEQEITINFTTDNIINELAGLRIRPDIYTINYEYKGTEVGSTTPKTYTAERPLIILSSLGDINADGTVTESSDIPLLYGSLNNKMPFDLLNDHEIWNTNYGIGSRIHYYRICDINKDGYVNTIDANMARAIYDSDGGITLKEYYKYTSN